MTARILTALFGACLAATPLAAQDLRVATEGAYPPFNSVDASGQIVGFDVDIANALCAEAGFTCTIVTQEWDGLIPGLLAEQYDVIIASMTITEARREVVDFTDHYYRTPTRFVAAVDAGLEISPEGMAGRVIGVQSGTVFEAWLRETFTQSDIRPYPSAEEHNADLVAGRVDAVVGDSVAFVGSFFTLPDSEGFEFVGPEYTDTALVGDGIGIALRQDDDEIRERLNAAIATIRDNGTYAEINARYFDFDIYGE
jgi:arginine/ornithine transport system substrate-binding protein